MDDQPMSNTCDHTLQKDLRYLRDYVINLIVKHGLDVPQDFDVELSSSDGLQVRIRFRAWGVRSVSYLDLGSVGSYTINPALSRIEEMWRSHIKKLIEDRDDLTKNHEDELKRLYEKMNKLKSELKAYQWADKYENILFE